MEKLTGFCCCSGSSVITLQALYWPPEYLAHDPQIPTYSYLCYLLVDYLKIY